MSSLYDLPKDILVKLIATIQENTKIEVFVLSEEWYHDNGTIIGVFKTKEDAIEGFKEYRLSVDNGTVESRTAQNHNYKLLCYDAPDYNENNDDEVYYRIHMFQLNKINPTLI